MWHMGEGHYWGMHWLWWIFWIIIIVMFFAVLGKAFVWNRPGSPTERESALDILKRRYAAGEIDTEEYNIRKRELEKDR